MTRKQKRFSVIAGIGTILGLVIGLVLYALNQNITFFRSPSDIASLSLRPGTRMRIGGLVEPGSIVHSGEANTFFVVTDGSKTLNVRYIGLLPDLFREGQGVVAEGMLQADGSFAASSVLAKHDEKYVPREVVDALKKQGRWQEGESASAIKVKDDVAEQKR